ncbi:MAG: NAD-dependent epimerase/dehydratase family protein [Candidatus Omnitrophica bacterium]|nr:NAD-dependent epimerase/dehydratase family protein [Candidatus Omnitrophota bacterium]MBU2250873.1 NAD-dependent epimerase/dehydratase family protein [Candidatus Omnitrophota bacterium]
MERKIGVTGAAGFIGQHLVSALKLTGLEPIIFEDDICNAQRVSEFVSRCSVIFHLAAKHRAPEEEILKVNIEGGKNLVSAAKDYGNRRLVLMSTNYISRYPDSAYSKTKLFTEKIFSEIAGVHGCSAIIFRFPNAYGPESRPFYNSGVATFCWYEANGLGDKMPIFGDGRQKTDYIAIGKVIDFLIDSQSWKDDFKRVDVAGDIFSVRDLADIIHNPKKRKKYPALEATWEFFAKPRLLPEKPLKAYPVHINASGSFQELIHEGEITIGQLSLCTIEAANQRGGHYHTRKEEWFYLVQGRMALDFYTKEAEYLQTQLLTTDSPKFIYIPPGYLHVVRNLGNEVAKFLILCNEKFNPDDADTYRAKVHIL